MTLPKKINQDKDVPAKPGVYALSHPALKQAFVGQCSNLRHRVAIWEYNFRQVEKDPSHKMPVNLFPKGVPAEEWHFAWWDPTVPSVSLASVRKAFEDMGYSLINSSTRAPTILEYNGIKGTLTDIARKLAVPYNRAYYRLRAGKTLDEVFQREDGDAKLANN